MQYNIFIVKCYTYAFYFELVKLYPSVRVGVVSMKKFEKMKG